MFDVLGWVIDAISSFIKSRICSKEELKRQHLADIKKEVLEPMLKIVDDIYIPVLESQKTIIEYAPRYVQSKAIDVRQYSGNYEPELKIVSPDSERKTIYNPPPKINQNLYLDIKDNHYKDFISRYEKFIIDFNGYGTKWFSYALELQKIMENELGMPLFEGDTTKELFVEPKALASYIIEKIMRINISPINISETPWNYITVNISNGSPMALKGTRGDVQRCIVLVNMLISNDKKYAELYPEQEPLLKTAISIRSELDKIIKTYKLTGKCNYV
jgi:hypothetical protein